MIANLGAGKKTNRKKNRNIKLKGENFGKISHENGKINFDTIQQAYLCGNAGNKLINSFSGQEKVVERKIGRIINNKENYKCNLSLAFKWHEV